MIVKEMSSIDESSESEHEDERHEEENSQCQSTTYNQMAQEIADVFRQNIKEEKSKLTVLQVCHTVRDKIFQFMKFTTEEILHDVKLRQKNNIIHLLLRDLNWLGDDDKTRAKFWLAYKSEVESVLTTRKTEVCNQMKEVVVECKYHIVEHDLQLIIYIFC